MIIRNCNGFFWGSEYLLVVLYLCYKVMQYSKLVLVLLLALSSMLLHRTKTVLIVSTYLLQNFYSFLCSLLMSSTAVLPERRCDSLYYLAVPSLFLTILTHWNLHLLCLQSMFCSWASFKSAIDYFISLSRNLVFFLSHFHSYLQNFKVVVWRETTKSIYFEL